MIVFHGKSVYQDVAIGTISFYKKQQMTIKRYHIDEPEQEVQRFLAASETAVSQLQVLYEKMLTDVGEADAEIFEIHQMMLNDLDFRDSIENIIRSQNVNAEYAIGTTADNFSEMFLSMEDDYMRGRAADVKDVSERLLNVLSGEQASLSGNMDDEHVVIAANDLAPSETVQIDKGKVVAFLLQHGSSNSHTAILARSMGIPAIIELGEDLCEQYHGSPVIVDGFTGTVYIKPDEETQIKMQTKKEDAIRRKELLQLLKGKDNVTLDGRKIEIYANITNSADVIKALENDAGGIGLFRSEFLYLENTNFPTEEQQFYKYKQVAENMAGKKVIIRTLDIGADKQASYFNLAHEENPALGYRAIRICLRQEDIFRTQLRAILRASAYGNISIMFPMIIAKEEVLRIKEIVSDVKRELQQEEKIPFKEHIEMGIMVETPAAALISDELAKEVDFFSIGTNDLTQYTLAADRQNPLLESFIDTHHPALLKLIKMTADNAHKEGKWVGICGELGADTTLTETFLRMGIDELSVSANMVLKVRERVRSINLEEQ
jgi:phosphotransferase system enzyme I (PtsI)